MVTVTMMEHWLIRLHGDEDWPAWGEAWMDHVEILTRDWPYGHNWIAAPEWLREKRTSIQLDWGAMLSEVTKDDLLRLLDEEHSRVRALQEHAPHLRDRCQRASDLVSRLDPNGSYGLIWLETF